MGQIKYLSLYNYRNYSRASLEFGPRINLFVGKNGQGKTNCLEAIALLISGKSFRTSFLREVILHDEKQFIIEAYFERHEIEQKLKLTYSQQKKQMLYNDTSHSSFIPLIGLLQGVYFSGYQNQLIKGSPSLRRRFLDLQCSQLDPLYLHHLRRYQKALKERNVLLKERSQSGLDLYEELMSQSAPYLVQQRILALRELQTAAIKKHAELTKSTDSFELLYRMSSVLSPDSIPTQDDFKQAYELRRQRDLKVGFTSVGPHKDDVLIHLRGQEAKKYASEGQIQSLITALHLAEYQRLLDKSSEPPLFCVDDIGQNLDQTRLFNLYKILDQMGQVFITTPEPPSYRFQSPVSLFQIQNGQVTPLKRICSELNA